MLFYHISLVINRDVKLDVWFFQDVQAERDVLQEKCDKQLSQLVSTQTRLDDFRRRAEWEQVKTDEKLLEKISHLEEELVSVQKALKLKEKEVIILLSALFMKMGFFRPGS